MMMEYLVHEYTWSSKSIRQGGLGWGIKASSTPDNRMLLGELEKLAAKVEPDRNHRVSVSQLTYSPKCGFVLMQAQVADPGEDNRENKLVRIYQPGREHTNDPAIYLAPAFAKEEPDIGSDGSDRLPMIMMETVDRDPRSILQELGIAARLPMLLKAVYGNLLESQQGMNIVCDWTPDVFCGNAAKLMYAFHCMLPESLRKKAGFLSYTEENIAGVSFCFSEKPLHKKAFDLLVTELPESDEDMMYEDMAWSIESEDGFYDRFLKKASAYLEGATGKSNMLMRLFWLYYAMALSEERPVVSKVRTEMIRSYIPQLMFWSKNDPCMAEVLCQIRSRVSVENCDVETSSDYLETLISGYTKRAEDDICEEIDQVLDHICCRDQGEAQRQIGLMKSGHANVYQAWLCRCHEKEESLSQNIYRDALADFDGIKNLIAELRVVPEDVRKDILVAGIGLVNRDIFRLDSYDEMDAIVRKLDCERQWGEILKGFLEALEKKMDSLDDEKLKAAVRIEEMTADYLKPEGLLKRPFLAEQERRKEPEQMPALKEETNVSIAYDAQYTNAAGRAGKSNHSVRFIMDSIPQGFVTGCLMYLSSTTLMIGHWKIALGALGMWLIVMLNFVYTNLYKKKPEEWWKCIGLCLVEGFIIYLCGKYMVPNPIRLVYFGILGAIAIIVSILNLMLKMRTGGHDHGNAE